MSVSGASTPGSPYRAVLGDALDTLHPRLRAYFDAIPAGHHGVGRGTFHVAGTPRRWLWPALWLLAREGVLFPAWQRDVPFDVVNRPGVDAHGQPVVFARRTFHFTRGERQMTDAITVTTMTSTTTGAGLVDHLGTRRRYETRLEANVVGGALRLDSTGVAVRVLGRRIRLPAACAPRVALTERFDDASDSQEVTVTVDAPFVGRVYEYAGSFTYEIRPGERA